SGGASRERFYALGTSPDLRGARGSTRTARRISARVPCEVGPCARELDPPERPRSARCTRLPMRNASFALLSLLALAGAALALETPKPALPAKTDAKTVVAPVALLQRIAVV